MTMANIDRPGLANCSPMRFGVAAGMLVAVLVLAGCGDDSVAFTEGDALGAVEEYYGAAEAGDSDAIAATFADDPVIEGVADMAELLRANAWEVGQGTDLVGRTCTAGEAESASFVVVCEYGNHQHLQQVAGAAATPITETITVTADGIEEMNASYGDPLFPANDDFNAWMLANHAQDAAAADCCGGDGSVEEARANGELRREYADLWAASLE